MFDVAGCFVPRTRFAAVYSLFGPPEMSYPYNASFYAQLLKNGS